MSNEIGIYATILHRGGTVVIGSDSPIEPPGVMLHVALRALARYGLTAAEALRTATALPARVWGVDDDLGTLEPGKIADLAFVDGDPFANFDDLINITHVMKAGALTSTEQIIASHPPGPASTRGAVDHERWHALGATLRNQRP